MAEGSFYRYPHGREDLLKEFGFNEEEEREVLQSIYEKTGFPTPKKFYRLSWEMYDLSLEEPYFWMLEQFQQTFPIIEKLEDAFGASENSAFFGVTQQRLGAQQDKISQFLATTGKMIKELFQMVRELRILDERLEYYDEAQKQVNKPLRERKKGGEITLKGMFIDLVQGGGKSAASVYGMARELEFITLPDLFFDAPPFKDSDEMERYIGDLRKDFNENLLRVLLRHLRNFIEWKKRTHKEHEQRRRFMLQYLLQHFEIIKMYITWVKPYLKHVEKLTLKQKSMSSPEMVAAFENSMLDIELLARKRDPETGANGCVLTTFNYRTRPELKVVQDGYQRGPVHIGRFEMNIRVYAWSDAQVESYKKMKDRENFILMGEVSSSVQKAMEALGSELDTYLEEARMNVDVTKKNKEAKEPMKRTLMQQFLGDFYTFKKKGGKAATQRPKQNYKTKEAYKSASGAVVGHAMFHIWNHYKNFKKAHRMIAW
ncbi:hypothetical protein COV17_03390 [Candidatus Woesearchaeota archaeon CG10_big_fil_rev_8_21_14_0_10_36_11]|nr:MAG: hypothetical protein COV17_03390 [Candidatus Woesearchaeota archaeon CG10_big_fil_rev_8_21_14_0_10_36_11]